MSSVSKNDGLVEKKKFLELRSRLLRSLRAFLYDHSFIEVQTPVRIRRPALEDYIDAVPSHDFYLRTSPELHMKRMLAAGYEKIFQIGPCFRQGEHGTRHRTEFTMLEWYEANVDYRDTLSFTERMIQKVSEELSIRQAYFQQEWQQMTVAAAFEKYARISVNEVIEADNFEEVLCFEVEPHLGREKPLFLMDYPSSMAALSKRKVSDPDIAERWELYIDGLEIANAYSELTDSTEQRKRFAATAALRRRNKRPVYELDEDFLDALEKGMPDCSGVALGVDRLCMAFCQSSNIKDVIFE